MSDERYRGVVTPPTFGRRSASSSFRPPLTLPETERRHLQGDLTRVEADLQHFANDLHRALLRYCPDHVNCDFHDWLMAQIRVMLDSLVEVDAALALIDRAPEVVPMADVVIQAPPTEATPSGSA